MSTIPYLATATVTAALFTSISHPAWGGGDYPPMPEPVTSFGAVTHENVLYAFGGHMGERHEYTETMVSGALWRLRLNGVRGSWEKLPEAAPGQGLALVAFEKSLIRVGGMAARNQPNEEQDLVSLNLVQRFDLEKGGWESMPPMPAPRSSHDAATLNGILYVAGGWELDGSSREPKWHDRALVLDLANPDSDWRQIAQPFQRRALALAALGSRIYCIGGMNSDNRSTLEVDVYDTATETWAEGPDLPPGRHRGFGCSAIAQDGRVYANTFQGDLLRLSQDGRSWEFAGRLDHPRIAHRLVTAGADDLIAFGGEDGRDKRPDLERLDPEHATKAAAFKQDPATPAFTQSNR